MSDLRGASLQNAIRICSFRGLFRFLPVGIDEGYSAVVVSNFCLKVFLEVGFEFLEDFAWNRQVTSSVFVHSLSF